MARNQIRLGKKPYSPTIDPDANPPGRHRRGSDSLEFDDVFGGPPVRHRRRSDTTEFSDVFGGPPARSLGFTAGRRYSDSFATYAARRRDMRGDLCTPRGGRARFSAEFFDDIFRGIDGSRAFTRTTLKSLLDRDRTPESSRRSFSNCISLGISSRKTVEQSGFPPFHSLDSTLPATLQSRGSATANVERQLRGVTANKEPNERNSNISYFSILKSVCGTSILPVSPDSQKNSQNNSKVGDSAGPSLQEIERAFEKKTTIPQKTHCDHHNKDCDFSTHLSIEREDYAELYSREGTPYRLKKKRDASLESDAKKTAKAVPSDNRYFPSNTIDIKDEYSDAKETLISLEDEMVLVNDVGTREKVSSGEAQSNVSFSSEELSSKVELRSPISNVGQEDLVTQEDETVIDDIDSILENINEISVDIEEPPDEIEEYTYADLSLKEWSSGKERNIRSLLSTLHYILWPESGWQPVCLVDLVDCTSVKKAYLKAMLSLHPDKLQQRGVATHEKYIAKKVFDILQDAWCEFTSLTPI